jgi:hypothetical protein
MIRALLTFLVVFAAVFAAFEIVRYSTKQERWNLTKSAGYSIIVAVAALLLLTGFVILF